MSPDPATTPQPTAAAIIAAVEARLTEDRTWPTQQRYLRAREQLVRDLEARGPGILTDSGVAMLEFERALGVEGALLRVATGEDLLYALPGFIARERGRLPLADVRAQLRFAEECRRYIERRALVDWTQHMCAICEIEGAIRRARQALRGH